MLRSLLGLVIALFVYIPVNAGELRPAVSQSLTISTSAASQCLRTDATGSHFYAGPGCGSSEAVFNEAASSVNFRVEGANASNLFVVHSTLNSVGINIGTPASVVHIKSTSTSAIAPLLRIDDASGNILVIMRNNGNVGIGVTAPSDTLDVGGNTIGGATGVIAHESGGSFSANSSTDVSVNAPVTRSVSLKVNSQPMLVVNNTSMTFVGNYFSVGSSTLTVIGGTTTISGTFVSTAAHWNTLRMASVTINSQQAGITASVSSFTAVANSTVTISNVSLGGQVECVAKFNAALNIAGNSLWRVLRDGIVDQGGTNLSDINGLFPTAGTNTAVVWTYLSPPLTAGSHSFTVEAKNTSGSTLDINCQSTQCRFYCKEVH